MDWEPDHHSLWDKFLIVVITVSIMVVIASAILLGVLLIGTLLGGGRP